MRAKAPRPGPSVQAPTDAAAGAEAVRAALSAAGLRPNRALGQNFCIDIPLLRRAVAAASVAGRNVLEIGPGLGALTRPILDAGAASVVAIEKDAALAALLSKALPDPRLSVRTGDALKTELSALFPGAPFIACGNLPYYATTPIATRLLAALPLSLLLMVQREAAERFFARPGDRVYGPIAILAGAFYDAERFSDVPRSSYWPQPDVDSAIVLLRLREASALPCPRTPTTAGALLQFSKHALSARRKTMFNAFARDPQLLALLQAAGLPEDVRAEALPPETLARLSTVWAERDK